MFHAAGRKLFSSRTRRDAQKQPANAEPDSIIPTTTESRTGTSSTSNRATAADPSSSTTPNSRPYRDRGSRLPVRRNKMPTSYSTASIPEPKKKQPSLIPQASAVSNVSVGSVVVASVPQLRSLTASPEDWVSTTNNHGIDASVEAEEDADIYSTKKEPELRPNLLHTTRRISATFASSSPPSSTPTIASSTVTASTLPLDSEITSIYGAYLRREEQGSTRKPSLASTTDNDMESLLSAGAATSEIATDTQAENIHPSQRSNRHHRFFLPRIPRSRTFNVLSNLTLTSYRSPALGKAKAKPETPLKSVESCDEIDAKFIQAHEAIPRLSGQLERHDKLNANLSPIESRSPDLKLPKETPRKRATSAPNIKLVMEAMPNGYWAGRFQSLHDRFRSELLKAENLPLLVAAQTGISRMQKARKTQRSAMSKLKPSESSPMVTNVRNVPGSRRIVSDAPNGGGGLEPIGELTSTHEYTGQPQTTDTTTSTPSSSRRSSREEHERLVARFQTEEGLAEAASKLYDDDNRCRRVFVELRTMCQTPEANASLLAWQIRYSRRERREGLLPVGLGKWDEAEQWDWEHRKDEWLAAAGYRYEKKEWDRVRREFRVHEMKPRPSGGGFGY